jgi:predicted ATP-grasp superfamily ATP-dependent carboligase
MSAPLALIGFAEALAAPEVAWSLADAGYRVLAFTRRGRMPALRHSRLVECREITSPEEDLAAARKDLGQLLESLPSGLLFPLDDTAVLLCGQAVADVRSWKLAGPQGKCADLALNKQLQTSLAEECGFNVPPTSIVRTAEEARAASRSHAFPLILRPVHCVPVADGRIQKGSNWICANPQELERALEGWRERMPLMLQPFIPGNGEGVFGLATASGVQAWSAHRRLRMMNPHGSGSSACVSQAVEPEIQSKVNALIEKSSWRGLFMIELLREDSGKLWFVELNGRPWGSMALSRRQGLEYPAWQAQLASGEEPNITVPPVKPGVVCRNIGREIMHLLFVLRGPKSSALRRWPSFPAALRGVLGIRKADGIYNWRRKDTRVFFADCYNTIHGNLFKARH